LGFRFQSLRQFTRKTLSRSMHQFDCANKNQIDDYKCKQRDSFTRMMKPKTMTRLDEEPIGCESTQGYRQQRGAASSVPGSADDRRIEKDEWDCRWSPQRRKSCTCSPS
jgi:hypothetical protein